MENFESLHEIIKEFKIRYSSLDLFDIAEISESTYEQLAASQFANQALTTPKIIDSKGNIIKILEAEVKSEEGDDTSTLFDDSGFSMSTIDNNHTLESIYTLNDGGISNVISHNFENTKDRDNTVGILTSDYRDSLSLNLTEVEVTDVQLLTSENDKYEHTVNEQIILSSEDQSKAVNHDVNFYKLSSPVPILKSEPFDSNYTYE